MTTVSASAPAVRPWTRAAVPAVLAVAAFACTLALLRHGGIMPAHPDAGRLDPTGVALAACASLPLVLSARHPMGVFVVTSLAAIALAGLGYPADVIIGPALALYQLAASRGSDTRAATRVAVHAGLFFAAYLLAAGVAHGRFPGIELLHTGLAWGAAWFAGERTRLRRDQISALHARAERAEHEADIQRQLAVAEERARIARDLHDSAGHAINVIAVRAGAARLRHDQEPARSLTALHDIEELARQTAAQIDQIVGGLRARDAGDSVPTPPGVASLRTLVAHHRAAGLTVAFDATGTPPAPGSPADQAVYRILQEALTNAARHGAGTADVSIRFGDDRAMITVTNPVSPHAGVRRGGGHGLVGMRERVTLLGGTLATTRDDGAFLVEATLPSGPAA
ncbi:MAG: histidine kinase [Hamadaea sp.]|nr:histidine kinase [Hamadaea sp.]